MELIHFTSTEDAKETFLLITNLTHMGAYLKNSLTGKFFDFSKISF